MGILLKMMPDQCDLKNKGRYRYSPLPKDAQTENVIVRQIKLKDNPRSSDEEEEIV